MVLNGPDCSLDLELLGYELAQECGDFDDDNWLSVRVQVTHRLGGWTSVDPSLDTTEVVVLADWLASIASGETVERNLFFAEPDLSFELVSTHRGVQVLRVRFASDSGHEWASSHGVPLDELWIEIPLEAGELRKAVAALRAEVAKLPVRGRP